MLKKLLFIVLLAGQITFIFAQTNIHAKPKLGILPFTGGTGGDGETIAALFSFQSDIMTAFSVVPRTGAVDAIVAEQQFQMTGYTDSDTIALLGRMLNADYVVSGHIRSLGNRNLIITTIINVETFEQMAGDFRTYRKIEEVRDLLPSISRRMIAASKRDTSKLPKLAVAPFRIAIAGVNPQEAETLAQILGVEIANTGRYAVLPRTTTMQAALRELDHQMSGYTAEEEAKALGRAANAEYVLFADVRSLGTKNMFTVQILHVEDGSQSAGREREYKVIGDGIDLMWELAILLTNPANPANAEKLIKERQRKNCRETLFGDTSKFWSIGASIGTSFADPWVIGTIRGTIAPLKYSFLELGCNAGFISNVEGVTSYYSIHPFARYALFLPFSNKNGLYIGAGGSYMIAEYIFFTDSTLSNRIFTLDIIAGIKLRDRMNISYAFKTDFDTVGHIVSVGYCYRFKYKEK